MGEYVISKKVGGLTPPPNTPLAAALLAGPK